MTWSERAGSGSSRGSRPADAMDRARADSHHPNLRLGNAFAQLVACLQLIGINRELTTFDIDSCKFTLVAGLELGADFFLVNDVATPGEFLFAMASFNRIHDFAQ